MATEIQTDEEPLWHRYGRLRLDIKQERGGRGRNGRYEEENNVEKKIVRKKFKMKVGGGENGEWDGRLLSAPVKSCIFLDISWSTRIWIGGSSAGH